MLSRPPWALAASMRAWQAASRCGRCGAGEDAGDLEVGEFAGEAVGGEQEEVAGLRGVGGDVGLDVGLGADGAGDDVADGRSLGLSGGEEAGAELLFDQRVVLGEEFERAIAEAVAAAVADVGEPEGACESPEGARPAWWPCRGGRASFWERCEDGLIGGSDGMAETGFGDVDCARWGRESTGRLRLRAGCLRGR